MTAHARFSPSASHRWMHCPGSLALETIFPVERTSSKYAAEGTAAHQLLEMVLTDGLEATDYQGLEITADGYKFTVTKEMADYVQTVADHVRRYVDAGWTMLAEQRVEFSQTIGVPESFGTADIILVSPDGKHVRVEDLKYGMGVKVMAYEITGYRQDVDPDGNEIGEPILHGNPQLMAYACGVFETFDLLYGPFETVTLTVHQPRLEWIDEYECTAEDVVAFGKEMAAAVKRVQAQTENAQKGREHVTDLHPAEDACRWCPVKLQCTAHDRHIEKMMWDTATEFPVIGDEDSVAALGLPELPTADRLGDVYAHLGMLRDFISTVEAEVHKRLTEGAEVIGADGKPMKLVEGRRGARAWEDEEQAEAALTGVLSEDKAYVPRKIITASAAAKLLDKKATKQMWKDVFEPIIKQPPGKPTIALGSDPRPACEVGASEEDFPEVFTE